MNTFSNGAIVSFSMPDTGERVTGFISKPTKPHSPARIWINNSRFFEVQTDAQAKAFHSLRNCQPADEEKLPTMLREMRQRALMEFKFKKGMCVSIKDTEGEAPVYGRVVKGGTGDLSVISDSVVYSVSSLYVDHEDLPTFDSPVDRYSVHGYQNIAGHDDDESFKAKILDKGVVIAHAYNDGWGGGVQVDRDQRASQESFSAFERAIQDVANKAFTNAGIDSTYFGALDAWIHWDWYTRPARTESFEQDVKATTESLLKLKRNTA